MKLASLIAGIRARNRGVRLTPRAVDVVLRGLGAVIVAAATRGQSVAVPGLGVFRARKRKQRTSVLPRFFCTECGPGEPVKADEDGCCATCGAECVVGPVEFVMPAHRVLTFRAAAAVRTLRKAVRR